ncbi:MAG TPA: hypothetical protein VGV88_09980 [Candidatus Dormibacteraeota bacterium]|nr:hypothetical protein [Candidatus Dormibacteraeota bacterium]
MRAGITAAFVGLALCGCGTSGNIAPGSAAPLSLRVGETAGYTLYTHCGVLYVTINATTYYADPPLSDGSGNPPAGWGNPYDEGQITLTTATTANFTDAAGHKAHFTSTPPGPTPTVQLCD